MYTPCSCGNSRLTHFLCSPLSPSTPRFEKNLPPKMRAKIEEKIAQGWKFDPELWQQSINRHSKLNMAKVRAGLL